MARTKKTTKAKEPVRIRFKQLANGNQSIYLDIYTAGKRSYEFLHLYLIPDVDATSKTANDNTMKAATQIKAQRVIEINNKKAGIKDNTGKGKMLLIDWLDEYLKRQTNKGRQTPMSIPALKRMCVAYQGEGVMMQDVNKSYVLGFISYIHKYISPKTQKPLSQTAQHNYCACFTCALNAAVRDEIINGNPFNMIDKTDRIKAPESQRCYLTIDEVKRLIQTPCRRDDVKRAFLFSCYCGLRISDVHKLTWDKVVKDGEQWRIEITMQKTKAPLFLPLSQQALKWMPDRGNAKPTDKVFSTLPTCWSCDVALKPWTADAGISKNVTFHVARHTFATMMLTLGADLYTTSKLLGHTNVRVTQIYAKIINKKKDDAVHLADNIQWE